MERVPTPGRSAGVDTVCATFQHYIRVLALHFKFQYTKGKRATPFDYVLFIYKNILKYIILRIYKTFWEKLIAYFPPIPHGPH
jgi:hypothetical protein